MMILFALLAGCGGGSAEPSECPRAASWYDVGRVDDGVLDVVVTEGCDHDLTVTLASLDAAAFTADLPQPGDVVPAGDWVIEVRFEASLPGTYSAWLDVQADGLAEAPPKELVAVWGEDCTNGEDDDGDGDADCDDADCEGDPDCATGT